MLSPDKPKIKLDDDLFDRAIYAEHLAKIIVNQPHGEGLVIGVYGTWGSGKSTFLEYILRYLEQSKKYPDNHLITVRFNPWWFSGKKDLAKALLHELKAKILTTLPARGLVKNLTTLATLLYSTSEPSAFLPNKFFLILLEKFRCKWKKEIDILGIKQDISGKLVGNGKTILIVIDDIDRLFPNEVLQLFTIIKGLIDFPNVIYLLAMDRKVVTEILEKETKLDGNAFLEKIVQVPIELPKLTQTQVDMMLFPALEKIETNNLSTFNSWQEIYPFGIRTLINTPRDVIRFTNALTVHYPMIKNEVYFRDFFAMEAIRLFEPNLYDFIYENRDAFTQRNQNWYSVLDKKSKLEELNATLETSWPALKNTINILFPQIDGQITYSEDSAQKWRKECLICHGDILNYYFCLSQPIASISKQDISLLLSTTHSIREFEQNLLNASKEYFPPPHYSKAIALIEQILAYTDDIKEQDIPNVLNALCNVGDKLLCPRNYEYHLSVVDIAYFRALGYQLIKRLSKAKIYSLLKRSISSGKGLLVQAYLLDKIEHDNPTPHNLDHQLSEKNLQLNQGEISALKNLWSKKILASHRASNLLEHPKFADILMFLDKWENDVELRKWCEKIIKSDRNLQKFLERLLQYGYVTQGSKSEIVPRLQVDYLEKFIDLASCRKRLLDLQKNKKTLRSSPKYKIAISLFLEGTNQLSHDQKMQDT